MLRFAQNTTEDMSLASLRVALFNYIVSKQLNEDLLVSIEDLDKEKNIEGKEKEILELLALFSIEHKSVIYQSENLKYHQKMTMQLMSQKKAYACFCSDEKLQELKLKAEKKGKVYSYDGFCETLSDETVLNCNAPFTVRIKKPEETIKFTDLLKGELSFKPFEVDSFVILNHDKTATYNYACAIEDILYDISRVIRDEKYISDTPKQIYVRNQLNYNKDIEYTHISSIDDSNIKIKDLIDEGYLPSAIANYLVLLGNKTPKEIFTMEEAISWFDIKNISNSSEKFDLEKLNLINKKHLEEIDEMRFSKILGFADTDIGKLGKLYLEECSTIKEIKSKINAIFSSKSSSNDFKDEINKIIECLKNAPFLKDFKELEKYIIDNTNLNEEKLSKSLRYALTGSFEGPDLSEIYSLIKNYTKEIVK